MNESDPDVLIIGGGNVLGGRTPTTSLPVSGITGLGAGVATWLATPSSANLASAVTGETGTGALVFADNPTLSTPVLGAATATSINFGTTTLNVYSEGTWTPNQGGNVTAVGAFSSSGSYTRIGRMVTLQSLMAGATSVAVTAGGVQSSNCPFAGNGSVYLGTSGNDALTTSYGIAQQTSTLYAMEAIVATPRILSSVSYFV